MTILSLPGWAKFQVEMHQRGFGSPFKTFEDFLAEAQLDGFNLVDENWAKKVFERYQNWLKEGPSRESYLERTGTSFDETIGDQTEW